MLKAENKKIPKNEFSVNVIPRDEQKCIPACHTFYMSYDKHVKRIHQLSLTLHKSSKLDGMDNIPFPSTVITVLFMPFLP